MHRKHGVHRAAPPANSNVSASTTTSDATTADPGTATSSAAPAPPVASTAPCDNADLTATPDDLAVVDAATLCLVNQVRGQHGLPALVLNAKLQQAAQRHSDDMVAQNYFAHDGPAGDTPLSRVQDAGYITSDSIGYIVGENIAWGTLTLSTPQSIVNAWVNSPEHLANMLDPGFSDTGLAVDAAAPASLALGQQGAVYTQDFGGLSS